MRKVNLADEDIVRAKVLSAARHVLNQTGVTLGPHGKSVIIDRGTGDPLLVDDGRRVAENIKLDDPVEQLVARTIYNVTRKTDEKVGDGTTTSTVLAVGIVEEVAKNHITIGGMVGPRRSVSEVDDALHASKDRVIARLKELAKPVKGEADLVRVATVVSGSPELGKVIGGMYDKLGKDGHITMEFNLLSEQIETEVVPGYRFSGGYAAEWMLTDTLRKTCSMEDVHVLVANRKDIDGEKMKPILNLLKNNGKQRLVIIAPKFTPSFLKDVYTTAIKGGFPILCVRAPSRGEEAFKDIAVFLGAKYFSDRDEMGPAMELKDLGHVDQIDATDDTTILISGAGKPEDIQKRIEEVKAEEAKLKVHQLKIDRRERVSALSGGVGLIKIGAPTDEERNWLKHKIEDAKYATKHAANSGIVPGGGMTFVKIAKELEDDDILKAALMAPYETLKRNAGGDFKVGKDVFDPVAVSIAALENAVSAASKLVRIGGAIAFAQKPTLEEAFAGLLKSGDQGEDLIEEDND